MSDFPGEVEGEGVLLLESTFFFYDKKESIRKHKIVYHGIGETGCVSELHRQASCDLFEIIPVFNIESVSGATNPFKKCGSADLN